MARPFSRIFESFGGAINWYPGHMKSATDELILQLKRCDLVIQVADARIPFTSVRTQLEGTLNNKKRLVVLNKTDLADPGFTKYVANYYRQKNIPVLFTRANTGLNVDKIIDYATTKVRREFPAIPMILLIAGIPNVGKSTMINRIRHDSIAKGLMDTTKSAKANVARTGKLPGVTRNVSEFRVCDQPPTILVDTPGIMLPKVPSMDVGLRLALTGAIKDEIVGERVLADYLLYTLNKFECYGYLKMYNIKEPDNEIDSVLDKIAHRLQARMKDGSWNHEKAAVHFVKQYRSGNLGRLTLDTIEDFNPSQEKTISLEMKPSTQSA
eukprot:TRINITY_DN5448_c0_g1_i1.p1 TRINITY_DN5448_c0_g1~~TRINITY_DN5448_c0_g1_i1.p1  ORF type:complete len:325 (+),score=52.14 TRINITY_DN5448_c0_g1_i1:59-1033(+)